MTKSAEISAATSPVDLQRVQPPPPVSPLSVTDALQQISNSSSAAGQLLQQQYDARQSLSTPLNYSASALAPFPEAPAIRNRIQPSIWAPRDEPLMAPMLPCFSQSQHAVAYQPLNLSFPDTHDTSSRRQPRQSMKPQQAYCVSAEQRASAAIGSRIERVAQTLTANAGRIGASGQPAAISASRPEPSGQTPVTHTSLPGPSGHTPATSARRRGKSGRPSAEAKLRECLLSMPAEGSRRTEEWVQETVAREKEMRNATDAVMKDITTVLKRAGRKVEEIRLAVPDILNNMVEAMPELIKLQFDLSAKKYPTIQFPAGMQQTAIGVLTRVITLQARAQVNPNSDEARLLQEMVKLEQKTTQLQQSQAASRGAAQQRIRRTLNKTQEQYHKCLMAMFPQYRCLHSLSKAEVPSRVDEVIRYCTNAYAAAEPTPQPLPSQESSTLSQISALSFSGQETDSQMEIELPPALSPVHTLSEYSKFSAPPDLTAIPFLPEMHDAEAQTEDILFDEIPVDDVRNVQVQTDDLHSDDLPGIQLKTVEVQTDDVQSSAAGSIAVVSPAARRLFIDLDRRTSDSSLTILSPAMASLSPMITSPAVSSPFDRQPSSSLSGQAAPRTEQAVAATLTEDEKTFGPALLMWSGIAQRLKRYGPQALQSRLEDLADYLSLPAQRWQKHADVNGLTAQGLQVLHSWQGKEREITETEKTEWLHQFDYYLAQPKKSRATASPAMTREATPQAVSPVAISPGVVTPPPEMITIAGAPNLSWLHNNIHHIDAWQSPCFEVVPKLMSLCPMYTAQNTALVIVAPDDRVMSAFSAVSDHALNTASLLRINRSFMQSVAVIQYVNTDHYYAWQLANNQAYFFVRKGHPGHVFFNRSGCALKASATPGYCLTEAAALAAPGNQNIIDLQGIAEIGATLREQLRQVIIQLPATHPQLMTNMENHIQIMQQSETG